MLYLCDIRMHRILHLPVYHFTTLLVFWFIVSAKCLFMVIPFVPHHVLCNFWKGFLNEIFEYKSTLILQFLHDMLLTNRFSNVLDFHRRSPFFPPPPAHQCMAYTRQRVIHSRRHVETTFAHIASHRFGYRWFRTKPAFLITERPPLGGAWTSRAVTDGFHSFSIKRTYVVFAILCLFVCFIKLICCIHLLQFTHVLVFGSLWLNTLVKSPSMVTPALWHQYLESKDPHLRKHCTRVLSFIV